MELKRDFEKKFVEQHMQNFDKTYDPETRMCHGFRGKNGYGSKLSEVTVHDFMPNFRYAYRLLVRDEEGDRARAHDMLYRMLSYQEQNPARPDYGVWPYFIEERLEEMDAVDYNMADFHSKVLLQIYNECNHTLTDDLRTRIKDAIRHACISIIRRDVDPSYTNISVMGTYVTVVAGETFGFSDILDYGMRRLKGIYDFNTRLGSFCEFNSPAYTFVVLQDLSDFLTVIKDEVARQMIEELLSMAWQSLAEHFHAPTGQLAGPQYRAYSPFMPKGNLLNIERAIGYATELVDKTNLEDDVELKRFGHYYNKNLRCPADFIPYFVSTAERTVERIFMRPNFHGECFANKALQKGIEDTPRVLAYTYMNERYTLGSVHREEMWNQHKNLLGYFGTKKAPYCVALRFLHDGWDFCSCFSANVQEKGEILSALGFVTDRGDTHCNLDLVKDATVSAEDLRLTWQISGQVDKLTVREADGAVYVESAENGLSLRRDTPLTRDPREIPLSFGWRI